jgi:hypothetical protein
LSRSLAAALFLVLASCGEPQAALAQDSDVSNMPADPSPSSADNLYVEVGAGCASGGTPTSTPACNAYHISLGALQSFVLSGLAFSEISGTVTGAQLPSPTTSAFGGIEAISCPAHEWVDVIPTSAVQPTCAQPAFSDLAGAIASGQVSGAYTGITGVGTIAAGVWNGTVIGAAYGGSGVASPTAHGVLIGEGSSAFDAAALPSGQLLLGQPSGDPAAEAISGDCSLAAGGAITCTKTSGTAFGTAATANTGTSGATLGLLNGTLTFGGADTFSSALTAYSLALTGTTAPANGLYLRSSNTPAMSANGVTGMWWASGATTFSLELIANASGGPLILASAGSCTSPDFVPNTTATTSGWSGNGTKLCGVVAGADIFDVTSAGVTINGGSLTFSTLPSGTPATYACFTTGGALTSSSSPC